MTRAGVLALAAVAAGASWGARAAAGGAPPARAAAHAAAPRPGDRARAPRRALRVARRPRRTRHGHVPAWVRRPGPLPGSRPSAPALGGAQPGGAVPGTGPGTPAGGTTSGGTPPGGSPTPTCGVAAGARESEWAVVLSRTRLCAGKVTIEAQNWGQDPHDLWLAPKNGEPLWKFGEAPPHLAPGTGKAPGGIESRQFTLAPGTYELYCSLTGGTPPGTPGDSHAAAGMTATITVVAP